MTEAEKTNAGRPLPPGDLHLYVHIPFCIHKCAYCDFNSHVRRQPAWGNYREALLSELAYWSARPQFSGRPLASIFFGGGTPSLAPAELIAGTLEQADALLGISDDTEITLEANPGTVDAGRFRAYRQAGVNRLSVGVQSFTNAELLWLERIHSSDQAMAALATARAAGFDNLSLDLMYGLPGQGMEDWMRSLETGIELAPEHMSCYQLTVEAHTELANRHRARPLALPDDDLSLDFLRRTRARLQDAGYAAYEVSNFARPGRYCRHNDGYWLYHDYIGIGAGAAGKWDKQDGGITRHANIRSPEAYMRAAMQHGKAINSEETLDIRKAAGEAVWLGLRRSRGIGRAAFRTRFGSDIDAMFGSVLRPWQQSGHLIAAADSLYLSDKGLGMADSIAISVLRD